MRITIFGSGYVGLVTGACLADVGHNVLCVDNDSRKIENLKKGIIPIYEPGLENIIKANEQAGRLSFTTDAVEGTKFAEVIFIAVGTPPDEDGSADITAVVSVAKTVAATMDGYKLIVNKSTVPVGSADTVKAAVAEVLAARSMNLPYDVASNPEFLKEGNAIEDFSKPDRIIVGTETQRAANLLKEIYAPFNRRNNRVIEMDVRSAELTKYAANAMLATKISFMNQLAQLAERVGANIENVRIGIGSDERIGYHFIYPGVGYGGSCFPKDVKALAATARRAGMTADLIETVEAVNERQKFWMVEKVTQHFGNDLKGKKFALWGLSFKPNTDDMREAPARIIMEELWKRGATIQAYDPKAMEECIRIYGHRPDLKLVQRAVDVLTEANALLVVTEWKEFLSIDVKQLKEKMAHPVVFDGRNIYSPERMRAEGIPYYSVGRP